MMRTEHPEYLWSLAALAVIGGVYTLFLLWRKKATRQLGDYQLLQNMLTNYSGVKSVIKFSVTVVAYVLIVLGLINVQTGGINKKVHHNGIDIALLVDISNSMNGTDVLPSRLETARRAAQQLIDLFPDSRIAIIAFAGSSSTVLPLTPDHAAAQMVLANLTAGYAEVQGTDLGNALSEGIRALPANQNRYRAMVILSDGEDQENRNV